MKLASRFAFGSPCLRSDTPLSDDQIRAVAPSIYADAKHVSRSERYTYLPTSVILTALKGQGFQPFMVAQTRVRDSERREHTKHMLRMRHASQINDTEAAEVILLNSHDGSSAYQMVSGMMRFVCKNGLVCGDSIADFRVPHKGNIVDAVIAGAFEVVEGFDLVREKRDAMRAVTLNDAEQAIFARAALSLKYEPDPLRPAPITEAQLLHTRRFADAGRDAWTVLNRIQENVIQGGIPSRTAAGRNSRTRPVQGIDQGVKLNRALWMLGEEMARLKTAGAVEALAVA